MNAPGGEYHLVRSWSCWGQRLGVAIALFSLGIGLFFGSGSLASANEIGPAEESMASSTPVGTHESVPEESAPADEGPADPDDTSLPTSDSGQTSDADGQSASDQSVSTEATVEALENSITRPAPTDIMPDGPLKAALQQYQGLTDFTYQNTSTITTLGNDETSLPDVSTNTGSGVQWWTGIEFLPELRSLKLSLSSEDDVLTEALSAYVPHLSNLDITISIHDVDEIGPLAELRTLRIARSTSSSAIEMSNLAKLYPNLENLTLTRLNVNGDSLADVSKFGSLKSLSLATVNPSIVDLNDISGTGSLESLSITRSTSIRQQFSDVILKDLPNLSELVVSDTQMTVAPDVSNLPSLLSLDLSNNRLTEFPVLYAPKLKTLNLSASRMVNASYPSGSDLSSLKNLDMSNNSQLTTFVWSDGAPSLEYANLNANVIRSLNDVAVDTEIDLLDLRSRANSIYLTSLDGLDRFAQVGSMKVGVVADLSGANQYSDVLTKVIVNEPDNAANSWELSVGSVSIGTLQRLGSFIGLPDGAEVEIDESSFVNSKPGAEPNSFTVDDGGSFSFLGTISPIGNISFHPLRVSGNGSASLPGVYLTATGPTDPAEPLAVGDPMHFVGDVTWAGEPGEVTRYQWYSSSGAMTKVSDGTPIDGATGPILDVVNTKDSGHLKYTLVAYVGNTPIMSNTVTPEAMVDFPDSELAKCVTEFHGGVLSYSNLATPAQLSRYDCSGRGIQSFEGLQYVKGVVKGISGGRNAQFDLSHNQIADISPLTSTGNVFFSGVDVDLSYNQISDVSALWTGTGSQWTRWNLNDGLSPGGFNLDHNQVGDLSGLANLKSPSGSSNPVALSFLDQEITLPNLDVDEAMTAPTVLGPTGGELDVTSDTGIMEGENISFSDAGTHTLPWAQTVGQYVRFSGSFIVDVGAASSSPALSVTPEAPKAGSLMTFNGTGFTPGEQVELTWNDEKLPSAIADAAGKVAVPWRVTDPAQEGEVTVTARGEQSQAAASLVFMLSAADVVNIPDVGLRKCFTDALGISEDAVLYSTLPASLNGTLDCRSRGITDLTGLDAFQPLSGNVLLQGNALTSLTTLPTMPSGVWQVDVSDNSIADTGIMQPQSDGKVMAGGNQITDFRELQKAQKKGLSISGIGLDQQISLPVTLTGETVTLPEVTVSPRESLGNIYPYTIRYSYPDEASVEESEGNKTVTFNTAGSYEVGFLVYTEYADGSTDTPWASGTFFITVVNPYETVLNINPTELYPGQLLNATGAGFNPGEQVAFSLGENGPGLGQATATNRGVATLTEATIPLDTAAGAYQVAARGATSGTEIRTILTVKAAELPAAGLNINPGELYPGQVLNAVGSGFTPGEHVRLTLGEGGPQLGEAAANDRGVAVISDALVPADTLPGRYPVIATGRASGASVQTSLTVLSADSLTTAGWQTGNGTASLSNIGLPGTVLNVNPDELYPGQLLNAIGAGFTAGEKVNFTLGEDGPSLGTEDASERGVATLSDAMVAADTEPGSYQLVATGETSGTAVRAAITVLDPGRPDKVLNINPTELYAGQLLNAVGAGFDSGEQVVFRLGEGGPTLGQTKASARGIASIIDAQVPADTAPGSYDVVATGMASGETVSTTLTVLAFDQTVAASPDNPATEMEPVADNQNAVVSLVAVGLFLLGLAGATARRKR